jgi:hypothetical protein
MAQYRKIFIGFTGNRFGLTEEQKFDIKNIFHHFDNINVSHGDCIGADTDFHNLCLEYRNLNPHKILKIQIFPPDDSKMRAFNNGDFLMPEKPYLKRNDDIINNSEILIACPIDKNREILRSGTWSTIRKARKLGKQTYVL